MKELSRESGIVSAQGFVYTGSLVGVMEKADGVYQSAQNLRQAPNYRQLPSEELQPLEARWTPIEETHDDLSRQAPDIDSQNSGVGNESTGIDAARSNIESSKAELAGEFDAYNSNCAGKTLPPPEYEQCMAQRNDLLNRQAQLNEVIEQFNERVKSYDQALANLKQMFLDWANDFDQWVGDAKAALSRADTGTCTEEQHQALQYRVDQFCKKGRRTCKSQGLTCEELKIRFKRNLDCAGARDEINNTCYGGGDIHQGKANEARKLADKCRQKIEEICGAAMTSEKI